MVDAGDAGQVERAFGEAKDARLSLAAKPQVKAGVAVLQVPVPDRPGVLAEVTAVMSQAGVNIEDLQIVHSPEGGRGTVHLTVAGNAAADAERALRERWYEPTRLA
jgi:glycine cleavage system regulatory protein